MGYSVIGFGPDWGSAARVGKPGECRSHFLRTHFSTTHDYKRGDGNIQRHGDEQFRTGPECSDFFFNFFGFDPVSVNPIQDLGVLTNFLISSGSTSTLTPLFDVTLNTVPTGSIFPIEVQLEDINSDFSEIVTVNVSVPDGSGTGTTVPEPASFLLLAIGAFMICLVHPWRRFMEGLSPR